MAQPVNLLSYFISLPSSLSFLFMPGLTLLEETGQHRDLENCWDFKCVLKPPFTDSCISNGFKCESLQRVPLS